MCSAEGDSASSASRTMQGDRACCEAREWRERRKASDSASFLLRVLIFFLRALITSRKE
jgi:hypothetical protein